MAVALLLLALVNGEYRAEVLGLAMCQRIEADVRAGKQVVVQEADGQRIEVERARCVLDFEKQLFVPAT